jgi:hypothetical protein
LFHMNLMLRESPFVGDWPDLLAGSRTVVEKMPWLFPTILAAGYETLQPFGGDWR